MRDDLTGKVYKISSKIQRASCLFHGSAWDAMCVNHRCSDIAVAEEFMDGANIIIDLQEVDSKD